MSLERKDEADHGGWMKEKNLTPIETTFLTALIWMDRRFRIVDYLEILETLYYRVNLQMPKSPVAHLQTLLSLCPSTPTREKARPTVLLKRVFNSWRTNVGPSKQL